MLLQVDFIQGRYGKDFSRFSLVLASPVITLIVVLIRRVLPVVLDVGTNNEKLRADPRYLGIKEHRIEGDEYFELIDEFMAAIKLRWPRALIQFEDFQSKYAIKLLQRSVETNK